MKHKFLLRSHGNLIRIVTPCVLDVCFNSVIYTWVSKMGFLFRFCVFNTVLLKQTGWYDVKTIGLICFYAVIWATWHKTLNELHCWRQTMFVTVRIDENNRDFEKIDGQGTQVRLGGGGGLLSWLNPCRDRAPGTSFARKPSLVFLGNRDAGSGTKKTASTTSSYDKVLCSSMYTKIVSKIIFGMLTRVLSSHICRVFSVRPIESSESRQ